MNPNLQKAIGLIENQEIAEFFVLLKSQTQASELIARLEKTFILGKTDVDFTDQLKTLAHNLFAENVGKLSSDYQTITAKIKNNRNIGTEEILQKKSVQDLDEKELERFFALKRVEFEFADADLDMQNLSAHERLLHLSLAENGHLFKGTFLCLGKRNQIHTISHSANESKFAYFKGTERTNVLILETIKGNLVQQYEKMMMLMLKHIPAGRNRETNEDIYEIPLITVREFIANAYVHRSYETEINTYIQVEFFDDRIEIKNPGTIPKELDLKNITSTRLINPTVAGVFSLYKYVEKMGTGIITAQSELKKHGFEPATVENIENQNMVRVTIWKKKKNMSIKTLDYAFLLLAENRISEFFDWTENFEPNENLENLKNDFIAGKTEAHFIERLKMLAKILAKKEI